MEQKTWLEVLKDRNQEAMNYANRCMVEAMVMEKCIVRIERGEIDPAKLEKDAALTHTVLGQGEANRRELPGPGTIGAAVRKVMKELTRRKKGFPITTQEIVAFTQVELPDANPHSIKAFVYSHQNDMRRKRDIRNVGPASWVIDEGRMIEHAKPTNEQVEDTAAMVMRANPDNSPYKKPVEGGLPWRTVTLLQADPKKAWTIKELAKALKAKESSFAFIYGDARREGCPFKKVGPGTFQAKRGQVTDIGNGKREVSPAVRAKISRMMKESYRRKRLEKAKQAQVEMEQGETVNA